VLLAVILVLVVGTIQLIGGSANDVFSATASSIGQRVSGFRFRIVLPDLLLLYIPWKCVCCHSQTWSVLRFS
jgi:hypothetical protein